MPMGGAGSRFSKNGYAAPKPLLEIAGKPFLYWSTQSILKFVDVQDLTFVVLQDHIEQYSIDNIIKNYFPKANVVAIPNVLQGPVLTCLQGIIGIQDGAPILFNDCDHMFKCKTLNRVLNGGVLHEDGALLTFTSDQPQFSYVKYDKVGKIIGTIEKKVVSNHAICGAYLFRNAEVFRSASKEYMENCSYAEYFISGVYNILSEQGKSIKDYLLDFHVEFGTPEEYEKAQSSKYFSLML